MGLEGRADIGRVVFLWPEPIENGDNLYIRNVVYFPQGRKMRSENEIKVPAFQSNQSLLSLL